MTRPFISRIKLPVRSLGEGTWRVLGHGAVLPRSTLQPSQHQFEAIFGKVNCAPNDDEALLKLRSSAEHDVRRVPLSLGILGLIRTGDLWSGGRFVRTPPYPRDTFEIDLPPPPKQRVFPATLRDGDLHEVPPWLAPHQRGMFVQLATKWSAKRVYVPAMELLRFYVGCSTRTARWMIASNFNFNRLVDESLCDFPDLGGHARIHLRAKVPYAEAPIVARFLFDRHANATLLGVARSLASARGAGANPAMLVPGEGETQWQVTGRWAKLPTGEWGYFVQRLHSCSLPYPFWHLAMDRDNRADGGDAAGGRQTVGHAPRPRPPDDPGPAEGTIIHACEDPRRARVRTLQSGEENPFPGLNNRHLFVAPRTRALTHRSNPVVDPNADRPGACDGTGEGRAGATAEPYEVAPPEAGARVPSDDRGPRPYDRFSAFYAALRCLSTLPGIECVRYWPGDVDVASANGSAHRHHFPRLYRAREGREPVPISWSYVTYRRGRGGKIENGVVRLVVVALVRFNGRHAYVFEAERRIDGDPPMEIDEPSTLVAFRPDGGELRKEDIDDILKLAVRKSGVWTTKDERLRDEVEDERLVAERRGVVHAPLAIAHTERAVRSHAERIRQVMVNRWPGVCCTSEAARGAGEATPATDGAIAPHREDRTHDTRNAA